MAFAVRGLRKTYGGIEVLKGVALVVQDGEIHALLGANGAGKSTLIKCISGAITPDAGEIVVDDQRFPSLTPKEAQRVGVAVVYQELSLALSLTVADNVFLGRELRVGPFVRRAAQQAETARWLAELGVSENPRDELTGIGNAELQAIEIIKALVSRPKVLILDEPTASLSKHEAELLGHHLKQLKKQKLPVLYVTHRLGEVFDLADRVTVLRGGKVVLTGRVEEFTRETIVRAIVGRSVQSGRSVNLTHTVASEPPLLRASNLLSPGIGPVSFELRPGEIVGVFGLVGSGRTELLETLFGAQPLYGGTLEFNGTPLHATSPADAVKAGIALVPADRLRKSVLASLPASDNILISSMSWLGRAGIRRLAKERGVFDRIARRLNLEPRRSDLEARRFSGGNQQKLVLARWLNEVQGCKLLLCDEPTQGVDVGGRREIYDALRAVAGTGERAVLVTSSEPDELMQIAHRIIVLSGGQIAGVLSGVEAKEDRLLTLAHKIDLFREAV